uniref:ESSS n=1 Tax=Polytomella sp. Pringsheim 198.80 TaxID=37502 RepID=UPI001733D829|nr:Chain g, ESSS [Polytomella sp. Pringsheim 198.80]7ARD_g Chain g, ESSS [Polytomella sp. Pringsheim 198.80]|eukprot:CAMPEP_0175062426 /NCGR_PEP_ID=MMETSP0052_2-20121109/14160_1 /TAXON_ID=51329 ORGANISM="Polytomella parva, Strain SAG 63-3" /NCGR_SAMPLE_ID=MMETSP0052_2 /ASSEMBLY_ACC=CAM_ASM_000194 /LENGTH=172 /DNA_ID=CAMNT_0016328443 /DNA_START=29 /DNA_END=547 /DNA_ORIENTATION=-
MNRIPALRRIGAQALRNPVTRAGGASGHPNGSFWSEGTQVGLNGFKYGEIPLPNGQPRKKLWLENIWNIGYGGFFLGAFCLYYGAPPGHVIPSQWATPKAKDEYAVDMKMIDKYNERPDLQARLSIVLKDLNMIEEEAYDLIMMRKDYKVLLGLHSGRVPADLKAIYEELEA